MVSFLQSLSFAFRQKKPSNVRCDGGIDFFELAPSNSTQQLSRPGFGRSLPHLDSPKLRCSAASARGNGRAAEREIRWADRKSMFDPQRFRLDVETLFAFLRTDYGFATSEFKDVGKESWVTFSKPGIEVTIHHELGSGSWVSLTNKADVRSNYRNEFGLHELLQEKQRHAHDAAAVATPNSSEVRELAEQLRAEGGEVLRGDFSILEARHQRHRDAVGRPTRGGPTPRSS